MSSSWQKDVAIMMAAFEQVVRFFPTLNVSDKEKTLRKLLIEEEVEELLTAIDDNNLEKIADGIADSLVVILGAAVMYGIDLEPIWHEVHRSNMGKTSGPTDLVTGKKLKPVDWCPPNIKELLNLQHPDEDL